MNENKYFPIIGLEVHVELATKSKMFCGCPASWFGKEPNTQTCPVCLGLPGALPVPNKKAIEWCIMIGMALNCEIPLHSKFDRKNYFYPDLPKGYQISQYDNPFCVNGWLNIKSETNSKFKIQNSKKIRIRRVHMEEDTAKLIHQFQDQRSKIKNQREEKYTLIDFNRSGVPLVEIVTEPDIHSADEAKEYLEKLQRIIRHLGVSSCDMEKGSMRLEPNISLQDQKSKIKDQNRKLKLPDYKVEVKNINSFKFVEKAINYEIKRQRDLLKRGKEIHQETKGWDEKKGITFSQRSKEEAKDYRYFPEPDIPPIKWSQKDIEKIRKQMPIDIDEVVEKFKKEYQLSDHYLHLATASSEMVSYFQKAVELSAKEKISPTEIANVLFNKKINIKKTASAQLVKQIASHKSKRKLSAEELKLIVEDVVRANEKIVADIKKGKQAAVNVLVGKLMQKTKGAADPQEATRLIISALQGVPLQSLQSL